MSKKIAVFVAWPYPNGELHLGHIAGAYLPPDIFARYHRLRGNDVMMVSGSDAHGTPITLKAREEGITPIEVVNRYHEKFIEGWLRLGISFDLFTHTHTTNHIEQTKDVFLSLHKKGDLTVKGEDQYYDEKAELFLADRYVRGSCPKCKYERARGDQCESCGTTFEGPMLVDPVSTITNTTPVIRQTDHFYFEMGKYEKQLKDYVDVQPHWRLAVKNFTSSMIDAGLRPRPITRDIDWGVQVPVAGWENKVIYVWFDAVIGYLSAAKEFAELKGSKDGWKTWWENKDARTYYFIGKDNIPFHTVIWPIELMAYDSKLNLPYDVPANQFLNIEGEKLSTSRGMAVWLLETLDGCDADALRYYMTSILPETKDSNFSKEEFKTRNNGELVAAWGNLVNRVLSFSFSRFEGKVPIPAELIDRDREILKLVEDSFNETAKAYEEVRLRDALKEALRVTREVNKYLDDTAPWTAFKTDPVRAGTIIYTAIRAIDSLKILFAPILPTSCEAIHQLLGNAEPLFGSQKVIDRKDSTGSYKALTYMPTQSEVSGKDRFTPSTLKGGESITKPGPLFKLME
jgi:methionyl-tRNA synthetase